MNGKGIILVIIVFIVLSCLVLECFLDVIGDVLESLKEYDIKV